MGAGLCGSTNQAHMRYAFVQDQLTQGEREAIARVFLPEGAVGGARDRSELKMLWKQLGETVQWAAAPTEWEASKASVARDSLPGFWRGYLNASASDDGETCTLATFEFVCAGRKVARCKKIRDGHARVRALFEARGFRRAVMSGIELVVQSLQEKETCSAAELAAVVRGHYGVNVPAEFLPCDIPGLDPTQSVLYESAEFVGVKDMDQAVLLRYLPREGVALSYCAELQRAFRAVFPTAEVVLGDSEERDWLPWLHTREWADAESCLEVIREAQFRLSSELDLTETVS
eukprot:TRINITY_DN60702_c0_g1_i3.p1 TRINITY_DN60702_c0_g1~~TRINITY_DN60702_c0_g1_i3.p1  ORF type:complete len:289 (+),score=63.95 TRINITY_DN60702_c0_g1_i3:207-1073(+)